MTKFNYPELFILKNLRDSLKESYSEAMNLFQVDTESYLAVIQRLTVVDPFSLGSSMASATVTVTDFVRGRHIATVGNLMEGFKNISDNESELWIAVSMLVSEGLIDFAPQRGIIFITKEGLSAIRSAQMRD